MSAEPRAPRRPVDGAVPQYRQLPCTCGNPCFSFTPEGERRCDGPRGCGLVRNLGEHGREVVWWRI